MSTIDPAVAREERARSRQGSPRVATFALLLLILGATGAVVAGLGFGFMVNDLRDSALSSVFAETGTNVPAAAPALVVAVLGIAGLPFGVVQLQAYRGRRDAGWWALGVGVACFAACVALSIAWWTEPLEVGVAVDPVFHDDEAWSAWGWVMYSSNLWLPVVLFALAAAVTVGCSREELRK